MTEKWTNLLLLICSPILYAGTHLKTENHKSTNIDTSINTVYARGENESTGSITWTINANDFQHASAAQPIFLRISPSHRSKLGETLVDQASTDPILSQPIYLTMRLDGEPTVTITADPTAVSIVRWVAGESSFWIRVQESSETWLSIGLQGPNLENEVSFTVGVAARISDQGNDAAAAHNGSNLPFNTRVPTATEGDFALAVSTILCLDLTESNIQTDGTFESLLDFDILAFDENADLGNGVFSGRSGNNTGISFRNDFWVARAKNRACSFESLVQGQGGSTGGDLVTHTQEILVRFDCLGGGNYLDTNLATGSIITLSAVQPGYGFGENGARFTFAGQPTGFVTVNPESRITLKGIELFTEINLTYTGSEQTLRDDILLELDIQYHPDHEPVAQIELDLLAANHVGRDNTPYDGDDQFQRCLPGFFAVEGPVFTVDLAPYQLSLPLWPSQVTILDLLTLVGGSR